MFRLRSLLILAWCVAWIGSPSVATAQHPLDPASLKDASSANLNADAIYARLKKVEESKDLEVSLRMSLTETYKKILAQLKAGDDFVAKGAAFGKATTEAPTVLQQIRTELMAPAEPAPTVDPALPLAQMQQEQTQAETRLAEAQKKLTDLQAEPKRRADRRLEIPKLQDAARKVLADIETQLAVKPPADENVEVTEANRLLLEAKRRAAQEELNSYDQELKFYEAASELITARRDQAVMQVAQADQAVKVWRAAANDRRTKEAEQQARDARKAALKAHPAIARLAKESADLTAERQELAGKIERVTGESDDRDKKLADLEAQFAKVTDRVKRVGLTQAIGLLLRKQREALPNVEDHRRDIEARQAEISKINLELVDFEDQRAALADIDARTKQILDEVRDSVNSLELPLIEEDVRQFLQTKRGYLDSLIADMNSYLDKLVELDTRDRQLISKVNEYSAFSNEYILWIRSTDVPQRSDLPSLVNAATWLTSPAHWQSVGTTLWDDIRSQPAQYLFGCALILLLTVVHRTWKRWLRDAGSSANKSFSTSFRPTATALALTVLVSVTWPAAPWLVGMRLGRLGGSDEFITAVGHSFRIVAVLLLTIEVSRHVCGGGGLGEAHFGWPIAALRQIRRGLRLLLFVGLPLAFVVMMTESQASEPYKHTLGRAAFLMVQVLLAFLAHRVWWATQVMSQDRSTRDVAAWSTGFRRIWYASTVGAPVALALLAFLGYYYTAVQLEWRLIATIWLTIGLVIVNSVMIRVLLLAYRDLAIRRARERRAAEAAAATAASASATTKGTEAAITPEMSPVKLSDINQQTRKLVQIAMLVALFVGLSLIWVEVLPALRVFRRVELWPHMFTILDATANSKITEGTLTLADAIIAALITMVTVVASRNIPGLLEISVLRQLTLDSGARYAITSVSRYVITVLGFLMAFAQLGVAWSHVQWLVAAVSVGLGFGLQEIFANFVSGLILLFERPIRIGDIVSVDDVTGKITRIRIRATTITDWDMRELVVPNKEFITGRVMNWTLSDTTARMTLKVGVAYGTDPDLTKRLLLEVANKNSHVLKEPPPHALFDEFGDSTLNFTLRVYMQSLDVYLITRHELHSGINAAFAKAGIEIAFPQRDIHIRSTVEPVPNASYPARDQLHS